jgi:hypothetical protein
VADAVRGAGRTGTLDARRRARGTKGSRSVCRRGSEHGCTSRVNWSGRGRVPRGEVAQNSDGHAIFSFAVLPDPFFKALSQHERAQNQQETPTR